MAHIHQAAGSRGISQLFADVSLTTEPFFGKNGFVVEARHRRRCEGSFWRMRGWPKIPASFPFEFEVNDRAAGPLSRQAGGSLPTPNGVKVSIMLEETGLPYEPHRVSFETNDQTSPEFLSLNPNNKIPAILARPTPSPTSPPSPGCAT